MLKHYVDANRMLITVRQLTDAHHDVDALLDHVDDPVRQQGVDRHIRMTTQVISHDWRHEQIAEQHRRSTRQLPARQGMAARRRILGLLHLGKYPPAVIAVTLPGFGQVHSAGGAHQQLRNNVLLQRRTVRVTLAADRPSRSWATTTKICIS